MLDFVSRGAQGHGPVHLLLISAAELGFSWDGAEKGWVRVSLPPLRMMTGPLQLLNGLTVLDAWRFGVFPGFLRRRGFGEVNLLIFKSSLQLLNSTHLRERDEILLRAILCGVCLERIPYLVRPRRKTFLVVFVVKRDGDGHLFWECPFHPPLLHVQGIFLSLLIL